MDQGPKPKPSTIDHVPWRKTKGQNQGLRTRYEKGGPRPRTARTKNHEPRTKNQGLQGPRTNETRKFGKSVHGMSERIRNINILHVTRIEGPVIGNPAIKIVAHKTDFEPNKVSIDITPTIRSRTKDQGTKYYIAKRKHSLKRIPDAEDDPRYNMLWLESDSPYEKKLIDAKKPYEIKNLKTMKHLFKNDVAHSHIWKKIFLSQTEPFPESQTMFMEVFIDTFIGWLEVEMAVRKHRGSDRFGQANPPSENSQRLVASFSKLENILERYKDKEILKWYKKFRKLSGLLHEEKFDKFMWKTIGEEKLGEMGEKTYAGKFTNSDTETEEDSDSDLEKPEITDFYEDDNDASPDPGL